MRSSVPNHTRPTGFSRLPPPGPAIPVVENGIFCLTTVGAPSAIAFADLLNFLGHHYVLSSMSSGTVLLHDVLLIITIGNDTTHIVFTTTGH